MYIVHIQSHIGPNTIQPTKTMNKKLVSKPTFFGAVYGPEVHVVLPGIHSLHFVHHFSKIGGHISQLHKDKNTLCYCYKDVKQL